MKTTIKPFYTKFINQFFCCLFLCSFLGCQKNINQNITDKDISIDKASAMEIAYPLISGSVFKTKYNGTDISVEKKGENYVWMGDIVFDQRTFDSLNNSAHIEGRTFRTTTSNHWPRGEVFFNIGSGFTVNELSMINAAINHWRNNTSLRFTQRNTQPNFIQINRGGVGTGMYSDFVGMKGGQQYINLEQGVFITGNIIHEIGHAIGFIHEQNRIDRNNWIRVFEDRITPNTSSNIYQFQTYTQQGIPGGQIGAFDFNSIMLYNSFAFSDGTHPTMTLTDSTTTFGAQRNGLSIGDIETASFIYGPPFGKLRYNTIYQYEDDSKSEIISDVYLDLYSDALCTQPFTLTASRNILYSISTQKYEYINGTNYNTNYTTPLSINLSSGSSSVLISQLRSYEERDGTWRTTYSENSWINSAILR